MAGKGLIVRIGQQERIRFPDLLDASVVLDVECLDLGKVFEVLHVVIGMREVALAVAREAQARVIAEQTGPPRYVIRKETQQSVK